MYKKGSYILARAAGLILVLILAGIWLLQTPRVQSALSEKALALIEDRFDGKIGFSSLEILPLNAVLLKDVVILDSNPYISDEFERGWDPEDTLFHAGTVSATLGIKGLLDKEGLHLKRVVIEDAGMHLIIEPCQEPGRPVITNLERIFRMKKPQGEKTEGPDIFDIRKLKISNMRFRMNSFKEERTPYDGVGINYDDMDLVLDARGHNMKFTGSRMYAVADMIRLREKCGYEPHNISGRCKVGMGRALVEDIHLTDDWSDIRVKSYSMTYRNGRELRYFTDRVLLDAEIDKGTLSTKTIAALSGALGGSDAAFELSGGIVHGYINDLNVSDLKFTNPSSGVSGTVTASCVGVPDMANSRVEADIRDLKFSTTGIDRLVAQLAPGAGLHIGKYAPGQRFTARLKASGPMSRIRYSASLRSGKQQFSANGTLRNILSKGRPLEIEAAASASAFDVGRAGGWDFVGPVSFKTSASAILNGKLPTVNVDSLVIDKAMVLGHEYGGMRVSASIDEGDARFTLLSSDPDFTADIKAGGRIPSPDVSGTLYGEFDIKRADLEALGLLRNGGRAIVGAKIGAELNHSGGSDLSGEITIPELNLETADGVHGFGGINADVKSVPGNSRISIRAPFADATYIGSRAPGSLWEDLKLVTARREIPALFTDSPAEEKAGKYDINIDFHDTRDLLAAIKPGLYIAEGTRAAVSLAEDGMLLGNVNSPRLALGTNYIKGADLTFDNLDRSLNATLTGKEVKFAGIGLSDAAVTAYAQDNAFSLSFHYDNSDNTDNVGELYLNGDFSRDERDSLVITAHPLSSYIIFENQFWDFAESEITIRGRNVQVDDFAISCADQSIHMDGGFSTVSRDTLSISLNNFDLGIVDNFFVKHSGIRGRASGKAFIKSPTSEGFAMLMNLGCDSLSVNGIDAGSVRLASMWDDESDKFNVFLSNTIDGRDALYAHADYYPATKSAEASASFDNFNLALLSTALSGVFDATGGALSGSVSASGPLDRPEISSSGLYLDNAMVKVSFTGVPYYLSGPLRAGNDGLFFDSLAISDGGSGSGTVTGALRYDRLREPSLDARLGMNGMKVINLPEQGNSGFYGSLSASGSATVTGPFDGIQIDAVMATSGEGDIHVPLNSAAIGSTSDLLTFYKVEDEPDPYEEMIENYSPKRLKNNNFYAKARVRATREVKAFMEIEKSTGNVMTVSGDGSVSLEIRPSKAQFNFNGDYNIAEGNYHFVIPGILERDFGIDEGSSIKFGGDIMDTELNVNTSHTLKTSLATLLADTTAVATRRTVQCGLSITDKIRNPQFGFSIDVPDLDPTTKALVESALNTEDKVQKQFLSLLLFGTFFPNEQSGIVNGGNMLYSNVTGIMSNQLNSILQKLEIPLDFGLGYQQNQNGTDIFDVAVSTQLFNNKVLVNGSVGNRQYSTSTNPRGDVVGDLDIEIKLDNPGQFRVNLFSHSADEYTSFLDYSQRNGVGLSYQKEFNSFGELKREIFGNKNRKEGRRHRRGMVTIELEKDEQAVSDTNSSRR